MMQVGAALEALIAGLRGHVMSTADWRPVIALANRTLLTPALFSALAHSGEIHRLPDDVREYLGFIHDRNRERNARMRAQLLEAVAALNRLGIVPLLLKGAVPLFLSQANQIPVRMTSDLDLSVDAADEAGAQECLGELGYLPLADARGMARPQDVGVLELRRTQESEIWLSTLVERDRLQANIPSSPSRALHWIVHDLFKEGDYWRGRIDLRHLHDLAQLAESDDVDWTSLRVAMPNQSSRNALDAQLLALHDLFGVTIPLGTTQRPMVRFQHWRRMFTARHPIIGAPVRLAGNLAWGAWRVSQANGLVQRGPIDLARRMVRTLLESDRRAKI
jgi:hypothetical protein